MLKPWHKRHIIAEAAEQSHGSMCMSVHETGNDGFTATIQYLIGRKRQALSYLLDLFSFDIDINRPIVKQDILY